MTQSDVVNKLSYEMAIRLGDLDYLQICRQYIQMALAIGVEHFTKDMEEIIILTYDGEEFDRAKSVSDCVKLTGIPQCQISAVLTGQQYSAGGLRFQKAKDKELIPFKKTA